VNTDLNEALERQAAMVAKLREEYEGNISEDMGRLHNQFVSFISSAKIPLPHVLLVLDMLKRETLDQAFVLYLGE